MLSPFCPTSFLSTSSSARCRLVPVHMSVSVISRATRCQCHSASPIMRRRPRSLACPRNGRLWSTRGGLGQPAEDEQGSLTIAMQLLRARRPLRWSSHDCHTANRTCLPARSCHDRVRTGLGQPPYHEAGSSRPRSSLSPGPEGAGPVPAPPGPHPALGPHRIHLPHGSRVMCQPSASVCLGPRVPTEAHTCIRSFLSWKALACLMRSSSTISRHASIACRRCDCRSSFSILPTTRRV